MIIAGQEKDLVAVVHSQVDSSQVSSGLMYCLAWLESSGAEDGYYWDTASGAWISSASTFPSGTHLEAGQWKWSLPVEASSGYAGATVHYTFTNNTDETFATTVCAGGEHYIRSDRPVVPDDIKIYEMEAG